MFDLHDGRALKRWFKDRVATDFRGSVDDLVSVRGDVDRDPRLAQDVTVAKVHSEGPEWIIRDFIADSGELKSAPAAEKHRLAAIATLEARSRTPTEDLLLKKLRDKSANLHFSSSLGKIVVIDMR